MKTKMTLREFVENCVAPNSICRLWIPYTGEARSIRHTLVKGELERETFMNWELLQGKVPQSKYLDCTFKYVSDIFCETCREAINICVYEDNIKPELYKRYTPKTVGVNCIGGTTCTE